MKKLIIPILLVLSGCGNYQLDPKKPWIVSNKDRYLNEISKMGICRFKVIDGNNSEYMDDSCTKYRLGDTINHACVFKSNDTTVRDTSIIEKAYGKK